MSRADDARLAILGLAAEDMFGDPAVLDPPPDPRIDSLGWEVKGYVTAIDALGRGVNPGQRVFYGFLAERKAAPGSFAFVVRGTQGFVEWLEDAEFCLRAHPFGRVEDGFYGIHETMQGRSLSGQDIDIGELVGTMPKNSTVVAIGHSLGAALATYRAFDLADNGDLQVSARLFASPNPGDEPFARQVEARVPDVAAYAYEFDVVPKVPFAFGYARLPSTSDLLAKQMPVRIKVNPACCHHLLSYIAMLDPTALDQAITARDQPFAACISSPKS